MKRIFTCMLALFIAVISLTACDTSQTPMDTNTLTAEQLRWAGLAESLYMSGFTLSEDITNDEKADFFRIVSADEDFYDSEQWRREGVSTEMQATKPVTTMHIVPLSDIESIIFTHLATNTFDPKGAFGEKYDEEKQVLNITIGGAGGARPTGLFVYTEEDDIVTVVLGVYTNDMYNDPPEYELQQTVTMVVDLSGDGWKMVDYTLEDILPTSPATQTTADIKRPQFLSDDVANSFFYAEAVADENPVISIGGKLITSEKSVTDFFESYENDMSCEINIYTFLSASDFSHHKIAYNNEGGELYEVYRNSEVSGGKLSWSEENRYDLQDVSLTDFGSIEKVGGSSVPTYRQVVSNYDIFDDYDNMLELAEKYTNPIYLPIVHDNTFDDMDDITEWVYILEQIVVMEAEGEDETFWDVYPEGNITVDEMMTHLNSYFEVDEAIVLPHVEQYMIDDDTIFYQGGLGGAYPILLVYDVDVSEDFATILCRKRSVVTGDVDMENGYLITVKTMLDGTFRYVSLQML